MRRVGASQGLVFTASVIAAFASSIFPCFKRTRANLRRSKSRATSNDTLCTTDDEASASIVCGGAENGKSTSRCSKKRCMAMSSELYDVSDSFFA